MTNPDDVAKTEAAPPLAPVEPAPESLSDTAPRYARVELLGRGGMGEVELCRDQRIGRDVAVKVIRAGRGSLEDARARFLREARVQGQLEHPAVVPVYDIGERDGQAYFTMKRVRGRALSEFIAERRRDGRSPRRLLDAFFRVCQAVDYAHERGVLHRDLKPGNLMLGDYGEVYVLDWGLAKIVGSDDGPGEDAVTSGEGDDGETEVGAVLGTPGYLAPEQLHGAAERRSDVYSLGAILFEILTARPLHDGGSVEARLASTIDGVEARPSVRAPELAIPPELEAICVRATARDPEERHATVGELASALERFLDGDRDLELRRRHADEHAEASRAAAERALAGDDAERKVALREIGRALGFVPQHPVAVQALATLLQTPPRELPPDAEEAARRLEDAQIDASARRGTFAYLSWVVCVPVLALAGIRDVHWVALSCVALLGAAMFSAYIARSGRYDLAKPMCTVGTVSVATLYAAFGEWMLLPCVLLMHMLAFALAPRPAQRRHAVVTTIGALVGVFALNQLGVLPTTMELEPGVIRIVPAMFDFHPATVPWILLALHIVLMITAAILVAGIRDALSRAERELQIRAWHLRQMFAT